MERNTIERPIDEKEVILYLPKPELLDKHMHYGSLYQPNDLYWGVGIEREFYLQSSQTQTVSRQWLLENQKPERYSVRYFQSYQPETVAKAIAEIYRPEEKIHLPILFNAHALYRCDRDGHHQTTYERVPKTNAYHDGTVIFEYLTGYNAGRNIFTQEFERCFCFDGDSIEVTTQNFYKATVEDAIEELMRISNAIIHQANAAMAKDGVLKEHLPLSWATANHGLAIMWTNPKNVAIFNNGTYQFNLTAPTRLDAAGHIADRPAFVARHKKIIRVFQWLEPLLIAKYGCGDTFSRGRSDSFARGSLRCAMSRYMGVGTYDTDAMRNGKYLQVDTATAPVGGRDGWYNMFHGSSAYNTLAEIGLDFCFNKHFNHGIEFRIFDWFPELQLYELLRVLVYCMDQALSLRNVPDPRKSRIWNKVCARSVGEGAALKLWNNEKAEFAEALGLKLRGFTAAEVWISVIRGVAKWKGRGECSMRLLRPQIGCCSV
jgi:hypothetical protein